MELIDNRDDKGRFAQGNNIAAYNQLLYKDPEIINQKIDEYFDKLCDNKPTIAGFALFLGFSERQAIYTYINNPQNPCQDAIKKAVSRIESKHEARLYENGCAGSIFWLKQRGYSDKPETNNLTDATLSELIKQIKPSKGVLPRDE